MVLDNTEKLYLERQVTVARAVIAALSLVALLETSIAPVRRLSVALLAGYLLVALALILAGKILPDRLIHVPLAVDFSVLAVFLFLTPSVSAFWFLFLFTVFALASRGETRGMFALVGIATAGIIVRVAVEDSFQWQSTWHWIAIGVGTMVSGLGMGFLGAREREHFGRQQFLEKITGVLRFDRGLTESIRQALGELTVAFDCEEACLAIRDDELERLFVWKVKVNDRDSAGPETLPLARSEAFLIDCMEVSMRWQQNSGAGEGLGWDRRTGQRFRRLPPLADAARQELAARSLLASTIDADGQPVGRVLLLNANGGRKGFSEGDLRWLERIVRQVGPPLENVFLLRSLRMRAVESERSRVSRDLHDGILQTLLSLNIQLDVLRHKPPQNPERLSEELASLQRTVKEQSEELRQMVTEMRPLRVESADLKELMYGFAERCRSEHDLAVELFIDDRNLRIPDRFCREIFQIYREALHNVKKHAHASHVVVKLGQDDSKVFLIVDDNGMGFSFSGRYASEELDQLRLGPISIKERTRSVGGTLTLESNPGHGARLTIEIPVN